MNMFACILIFPAPARQMSRAEALLRISASARRADGAGDGACTSRTEVYLSEFKDAAVQDPGLSASDFQQVTSRSPQAHGSLTTLLCESETHKVVP